MMATHRRACHDYDTLAFDIISCILFGITMGSNEDMTRRCVRWSSGDGKGGTWRSGFSSGLCSWISVDFGGTCRGAAVVGPQVFAGLFGLPSLIQWEEMRWAQTAVSRCYPSLAALAGSIVLSGRQGGKI